MQTATLTQYLTTQYRGADYREMIQANAYTFDWFANLAAARDFHPIIADILDAGIAPRDLPALVGEFPHVSREDKNAIAYCQTEEKARRGVYTRAKMGRFIARHFPALGDDGVRSYVSQWQTRNSVEFVSTVGGIIHAAQNGPHSCMSYDKWDIHPYSVYDPALGWKMAIRRDDSGQIVGRALIYQKVFVRTYLWAGRGTYAASGDDVLRDYLIAQGYSFESGWPTGTRIARIEGNGGLVCPYIDGCNDGVSDRGTYLALALRGEYDGATQTGCIADDDDDDDDDDEDYFTCEDCNDRERLDESWSAHGGSMMVCNHCAQHSGRWRYVEIRTGHRNQYTEETLMPASECHCVNGEWFHEDNMPEDVVCLDSGDYVSIDDAIYIESWNEYVHVDRCTGDDAEFVQPADEPGEWWERSECRFCEYDEAWYSDNAPEFVTVHGITMHPDNVHAFFHSIGQMYLPGFDD
jgi:hypothetical protein